MARIALIGTGGTIANEGTGPLDYLSYLHAGMVLPAQQMLRWLPDVSHLAQIVPIPFAAVRSKAIGAREWWELAALLTRVLADPEVDGAILTHGTGALEETAYFLHLTVNSPKPLVLVGAQRPPATVSSDAGRNFVDAVYYIAAHEGPPGSSAGPATAADPMGAVVVMDQQIHSARDVAKLSNHTLNAMESPGPGPLGRVNVDGTLAIFRTPRHRHTTTSAFALARPDPGRSGQRAPGDPPAPDNLPRVDIVHQWAGAPRTGVDAAAAAGAQGIVVVGFPPGTNTPEIDAAIDDHVAAGLTIVQASRAIRDPMVLPRTDLREREVLTSGDLSPAHTRILLALCVQAGFSPRQTQAALGEY